MAADVVVAGGGMAGLVAAARIRELGASVRVHERLARPGGAMAYSSGVIWRHRKLEDAEAECHGADRALLELIHSRLDDALTWLEELGAPVLARTTSNPLTTGVRFEPAGLTAALAAAAGEVLCASPLTAVPGRPLVVATGGFAASRALLRRHVTPQAGHLMIRAPAGALGDGLRIGLSAGGRLSPEMDWVYARAMPAPPARVGRPDWIPLAQLYARHAVRIENVVGDQFPGVPTWSESNVAAWLARQPLALGRFTVPEEALALDAQGRSVGERIEAAQAAGAPVERTRGAVTVTVVAAVTTTLGGLQIDCSARAADGVFAAGQDAGGWAGRGYASGLAAALVLGLQAAESAVGAADGAEHPRAAVA